MLIVKVKQQFPLREFNYTRQGEQTTGKAVALQLTTQFGEVYAEAYDALAEDLNRTACDPNAMYFCDLYLYVTEYTTENNVVIRRTNARVLSIKKF